MVRPSASSGRAGGTGRAVTAVRRPPRQRTSTSDVGRFGSSPVDRASGQLGRTTPGSRRTPTTRRCSAAARVERGRRSPVRSSGGQVVEHPAGGDHRMAAPAELGGQRRRIGDGVALGAGRRRPSRASAIAASSRSKRSTSSGQTHASSHRAWSGSRDVDRVGVEADGGRESGEHGRHGHRPLGAAVQPDGRRRPGPTAPPGS